MTPKEKAEELLDAMRGYGDEYHHCTEYVAKQCALIAVYEVLKVACPDTFTCKSYDGEFYSDQEYFEQVKKEIEKL